MAASDSTLVLEALSQAMRSANPIEVGEIAQSLGYAVEDTIRHIHKLIDLDYIDGDVAGSLIFRFELTSKGKHEREAAKAKDEFDQNRSMRLLQSHRADQGFLASDELAVCSDLRRHVFDQRALFWYSRFIVTVKTKLEENEANWLEVGKIIGKRTAYSKIEGGSGNSDSDRGTLSPYQEILDGNYVEDERTGTIETVHRILSTVDFLCESTSKVKIRNDLLSLRLCPLASDVVSYRAAAVFLKKRWPARCDPEGEAFGDGNENLVKPLTLLEMACIIRIFSPSHGNIRTKPLTKEAAKRVVRDAEKDMEAIGVTGCNARDPELTRLAREWGAAYVEAQRILNPNPPGDDH